MYIYTNAISLHPTVKFHGYWEPGLSGILLHYLNKDQTSFINWWQWHTVKRLQTHYQNNGYLYTSLCSVQKLFGRGAKNIC